MKRTLACAALAATLLCASPNRAEACVYGGCADIFVGIGIGVLVVGIGDIAVLGLDLSYALRGRWLREDMAVVNIVWGALNAGGGALLAGFSGGGDGLGWGLGVVGVGAIMILDGILSLALHDDERETPLGLALIPSQGGASLVVRGLL